MRTGSQTALDAVWRLPEVQRKAQEIRSPGGTITVQDELTGEYISLQVWRKR